jgi:tetratricopeptide (TPR) repeat protein
LDPVTRLNLGNTAFGQGHYHLALTHYLKGLEEIEENPDLLSDFYGNIGNVYAATGKFDLAVQYYQKGIKILRREENYAKLGTTFVNLGNLYADQGNIKEAVQFYKKGVLLLEEESQFDELSTVYGNLSLLVIQQEDLSGGLEYAEKGLCFAKRLNRPLRLADALHALARAKGHSGDLKSSISLSESAYTLFYQNKHEMGMALTLFHQASLFEKTGDLEKAIRALQEVVLFDEKYQLPKLAENRARLANLVQKLREIKEN